MSAAILMTYRESNPERRKNLLTTLRWLAAEAPETGVLVVEQDSHPRLLGPLPGSHQHVLFAFNPHGFNKAWGLNVAMRASQPQASVLVFTDADLIVASRLHSLIEACAQRHPMAKPYHEVRDLSEAESALVHAGDFGLQPAPQPPGTHSRTAQGEHLVPCGGMFAIRTDAFLHVGGWDERFVGWGGEDDALGVKLQRAGLQPAVQEGTALHLWHPRAIDQLEHDRYAQNLAVLEQLRSRTDAQLQRMAEVQRQIIGGREKYRPMESAQ